MSIEPRGDGPIGDGPNRDHFAPLTPYVRQVLFSAMQEANGRGQEFITPVHLLLGLLGERDSTAWQILSGLGVDAMTALENIRYILDHPSTQQNSAYERSDTRARRPIRLAPNSQQALMHAGEEAQRTGSATIGTAHLLLGIFREGSAGSTVLGRFFDGVTLEVVRALAEQAQGKGQEQQPSSHNSNAPSSPPPRIRMVEVPLDVSTLNVLNLLVEAGIKPTRADVLNWLIGAGMSDCHRTISYAQTMANEVHTLRETLRLTTPQRRSPDEEPLGAPPTHDAPQGPSEPETGSADPEAHE